MQILYVISRSIVRLSEHWKLIRISRAYCTRVSHWQATASSAVETVAAATWVQH